MCVSVQTVRCDLDLKLTDQKVFMEKRQRHLSAVEDMMTSYDYEQQYKLVNMVFDKMHEVNN